jgi:hypothetical protein
MGYFIVYLTCNLPVMDKLIRHMYALFKGTFVATAVSLDELLASHDLCFVCSRLDAMSFFLFYVYGVRLADMVPCHNADRQNADRHNSDRQNPFGPARRTVRRTVFQMRSVTDRRH